VIGTIVFYFSLNTSFNDEDEKKQINEKTELIEWGSGDIFQVLVDPNDLIVVQGKTIPTKAIFGLKEGLENTYKEIGVFDEEDKPLFIIPTFTLSAYSKNGFYDFYNGNCDVQCLTTKIVFEDVFDYNSSANAIKILQLLGYDSVSDFELHNNPEILKKYDKVIVLHNEYVSRIMFDAINSHNNVIFLFPNALYAEINVDTINKEITLIRGHGYPNSEIENGFDWENENTHPYEFNTKCENWEFYPISNGYMLNCYSEQIIWQDESFLKFLKDL